MFNLNIKYKTHTPEMAIWCNEKGYYIVQEKDGFYIRERTKTLEELKLEKIEELKKEKNIYKRNTYIKGIRLIDIDPLSGKYHYFNLKDLKYGWVQEDLDLYNAEIDFIANFYDNKELAINNAESKLEIDNISVVFKNNNSKGVKICLI